MGGLGSGRHGGRPTANMSWQIDIAWMVRTRRALPGRLTSGTLSWTCEGQSVGWANYEADMRNLEAAELRLSYSRGSDEDREDVRQVVRLTYTQPNYGGRRWWMICPYRNNRCGKLYLPLSGDRFAGRMAWQLTYQSQRMDVFQRASAQLAALERRLGCENSSMIYRPKGMWNRTFDRLCDRRDELDERSSFELVHLIEGILGR